MSRRKTYTYRKLVAALKKYDSRFEFHKNSGKGSERIIFHPDIDGRPVSRPIKCHGGSTVIHKYKIVDIIRAFKLPEDVL